MNCPEPDCNPIGMWPGVPSWEGEIPDETGLATRAVFKNVVRCYYAGGRWLIYQGDAPTANTLEGILSFWKSDLFRKNPSDYAARLSAITGWPLGAAIAPKTYLDAFRFLRGVTMVENGGKFAPYKEWMIIEGMRKAGFVDVPATPFRKSLTKIGALVTVGSGAGAPIAAWLGGYKSVVDSLHNTWVTGAFWMAGTIAGALTLYGAIRDARRSGS
jgi:hypothetical protein